MIKITLFSEKWVAHYPLRLIAILPLLTELYWVRDRDFRVLVATCPAKNLYKNVTCMPPYRVILLSLLLGV